MIDLADVTLAVLAGGAGRRMGGPKAWLRVNGEPIVSRLHRRMNWPGPTLLISSPGREHAPGSELFDIEACDLKADQGPLQGIVTALTAAATPLVAVIPVDMPRLSMQLFPDLLTTIDRGSTGACYTLEGAIQPLPALIRRLLVESAIEELDAGQRSIQQWFRSVGVDFVEANSAWPHALWDNLNTPSDLFRINL